MSLRGEITIECDVKGCHAEQAFDADEFRAFQGKQGVDVLLEAFAHDWQINDGKITCPQCVEEGKQP